MTYMNAVRYAILVSDMAKSVSLWQNTLAYCAEASATKKNVFILSIPKNNAHIFKKVQ